MTKTTKTNDNDLVLIGIGEAGYGFREPTKDELAQYANELKAEKNNQIDWQAVADRVNSRK